MKITKILLIRSSHYSDVGEVVKANAWRDKVFNVNYAEMGLPLLAAYTPKNIEVEMVDDCLDKTPETTDAQVVGISAMMIHYSRAVDLARHFRDAGKIVIMGGFLPTLHPELVIDHVNAICVGEGDHIWPKMLDDIENNNLQKKYIADYSLPLKNNPVPRYDLIKRNRLNIYPVQATRGCMHTCDYCSIICFYKKTFRKRPVAEVIRDIKAHKSRRMYFVDDNLMDARPYAKKLFVEMQKLNVRWGLQASPKIAEDDELLDLAYKAGCRTVVVGFETIQQNNLKGVSKNWAKAEKYREAVYTIRKAGISVHALIMLGLPEDTKETIEQTVDFLIDVGVTGVDYFILTPYPATPLGKRYLKEELISDFDINHYREPNVVFKHPTLTGKEIQEGFWNSLKKFYSLKNILKRLLMKNSPFRAVGFYSNLHYRRKIRNKTVPTHNNRGDFK